MDVTGALSPAGGGRAILISEGGTPYDIDEATSRAKVRAKVGAMVRPRVRLRAMERGGHDVYSYNDA